MQTPAEVVHVLVPVNGLDWESDNVTRTEAEVSTFEPVVYKEMSTVKPPDVVKTYMKLTADTVPIPTCRDVVK